MSGIASVPSIGGIMSIHKLWMSRVGQQSRVVDHSPSIDYLATRRVPSHHLVRTRLEH